MQYFTKVPVQLVKKHSKPPWCFLFWLLMLICSTGTICLRCLHLRMSVAVTMLDDPFITSLNQTPSLWHEPSSERCCYWQKAFYPPACSHFLILWNSQPFIVTYWGFTRKRNALVFTHKDTDNSKTQDRIFHTDTFPVCLTRDCFVTLTIIIIYPPKKRYCYNWTVYIVFCI